MDLNDTKLNIEDISYREPLIPDDDNDIMVIGVGGGGGNAVAHMFRQGVEKVTFVVCNTDEPALNSLPIPNKVVIGDGHGAGNVPEVARKAAEADIEKIKSIFGRKTRMVFITAGLGGGTGTGAAPVVARVAKERGLLTIGIVTIPFLFEGKRKILKALEGAEKLSKYVDALLIINNERLAEIYHDLDFFNAFGKADDTLTTAARSISEIITIDGYMNLDFNDVDTTLRNGGTAIISTGYGEGENRVTKAIADALNSPLLRNRDIYGSKKLLINLYMARNEEPSSGESKKEKNGSMAMHEIAELRQFTSAIDSEVDVIWGVTVDNSLGDKVKITILAAGFDVTIRDEDGLIASESDSGIRDVPGKTGVISKSAPTGSGVVPTMEGEYGSGIIEMGTNYIVLSPDQMDDDAIMEALEKNPTYNRDKQVSDNIKKGITKIPSQSEDDMKPDNELWFVQPPH